MRTTIVITPITGLLSALVHAATNSTNSTNSIMQPIGYEYADNKLQPIYKMPPNNVKANLPANNTVTPIPSRIPHNAVGGVRLRSLKICDYSCPPGNLAYPLAITNTVINPYSIKVGTKDGLDIGMIAAKVSAEISFTRTGASATSFIMQAPPGVRAYQGFANMWVETTDNGSPEKQSAAGGETRRAWTEIIALGLMS
ncbi:hypothetical protein BG011_000836 [Mortierella polycephala]|uniref:Uncharacterized protein n=1 Tax=Mortierella polycephala TaxID=41804 RepID=A0A9P6PLX5_9FUNG|nr:hypothetical protein BG011_000836 [Mortierella polycephala]